MVTYWFKSLSLIKYKEKNRYSPIQFAYPSLSDKKSYRGEFGTHRLNNICSISSSLFLLVTVLVLSWSFLCTTYSHSLAIVFSCQVIEVLHSLSNFHTSASFLSNSIYLESLKNLSH